MQRQQALNTWLQNQFPNQTFELHFAAADADFRRYFRAVFSDGSTVIAMDAPPEKMSIEPYLKVQQLFQMVNVPDVLHYDIELGFMALEDLGNIPYLAALEHDARPEVHKALLLDAIDELIVLQQASQENQLPAYDEAVLKREINLFPEWFMAKELGKPMNFKQRQWWDAAEQALLPVI